MRQSMLFTKTRKEAPKDEVSKNAQLLIRAGFIHKEMAGVYDLLPLGLRVIEKIKTIVREEMNALGGEEFLMTTLQRRELWEKTKRWGDDVVDVWFKSSLKAGGDVGFGWSHEEPIADMMKDHISSFRDLPLYVYQFQNKLRNELRAKSGIMRGREFIMKDMYSFCLDSEQHEIFYAKAKEAYFNVYKRLGLGDDTFITFASGGAFTQFSHEFQTITDAGEDVIYINREKNIAINEEVLTDETLAELGVGRDDLEKVKTAEVGNIFNFGVQKSEELGLSYRNKEGKDVPVWMGSYGIGITRVMGVLVEKMSDDKGIVWPKSIAPFQVHLIAIGVPDEAHELYKTLMNEGIEVLFDDRDVRPGQKFADSDLMGIPLRIVMSEKNSKDGKIEVKERTEQEAEMIEKDSILSFIKEKIS